MRTSPPDEAAAQMQKKMEEMQAALEGTTHEGVAGAGMSS